MRDSDWDIRREGRRWHEEEAYQRWELTPEKLEMYPGRLLWEDEEQRRAPLTAPAVPAPP